jgi:hypothetical protein
MPRSDTLYSGRHGVVTRRPPSVFADVDVRADHRFIEAGDLFSKMNAARRAAGLSEVTL